MMSCTNGVALGVKVSGWDMWDLGEGVGLDEHPPNRGAYEESEWECTFMIPRR